MAPTRLVQSALNQNQRHDLVPLTPNLPIPRIPNPKSQERTNSTCHGARNAAHRASLRGGGSCIFTKDASNRRKADDSRGSRGAGARGDGEICQEKVPQRPILVFVSNDIGHQWMEMAAEKGLVFSFPCCREFMGSSSQELDASLA